MQKYPPLATAGRRARTPPRTTGIFDPFYRGAFDAGRQVRIVHARQLHDPRGERDGLAPEEAARRHPVLVVPALYVADDATLDWLARLRRGGRPPGPRPAHRLRRPRGPGPARAGARPAGRGRGRLVRRVQQPRARPPGAAAPGGPLDLPDGRDGDPLGRRPHRRSTPRCSPTYDHPHFGRWPAVTTRRHGAGRVTYVGTVPGPRPRPRAGRPGWHPSAASGWQDLPASVTATTGTSPDGRRVHIVHNWSWEPARVSAPVALTDVLNGTSVPAGTALDLGAVGRTRTCRVIQLLIVS